METLPSPGPAPVARQMAARRRRILTAARETIAERGYEAVTMRELARAADVTVPTIYNLIGSKDEVLLAAIAEQTERFLESVAARPARRPSDRVLSVAEACSRELLTLPRYYRNLLQLLLTTASAHPLREELNRTLVREFARGLDAMHEAGHLAHWALVPALARRLTADLQMTSLRWVMGDLSDEQLAPAMVHGTSLLLLGVTTVAPARRDLERRAERSQDAP